MVENDRGQNKSRMTNFITQFETIQTQVGNERCRCRKTDIWLHIGIDVESEEKVEKHQIWLSK